MKFKSILPALAILSFAAVSCQPGETEIQKRKAAVDEVISDFGGRLQVVQDSLLALDNSMEEKKAAFEEIYNGEVPSYKARLVALLKKNTKNEAGLYAYQQLDYFVDDPAERQEIYELLSKKIREDYESFKDFTVRCMVADDEDVHQEVFSLSDFVGKGKYILVDFWASWCGPCCREIPNIASVYEKYAGDNFDVLSIAVWDTPDETFRAADEHGIVWNQMVICSEDKAIPGNVYEFNSIPQIMLFAPDGHIAARGLRGEYIEETVAKFLSESK